MRCLNIAELWELMQLELLQDNWDYLRLLNIEVDKGEHII